MKNCTNKDCTQINPQPFTSFSKQKSHGDGYRSQCKVCQKIYRDNTKPQQRERERVWRENNKEHVKTKQELYKITHKEYTKAYKKQWASENKEKRAFKDKLRRQQDILFRLKGNLRTRMNRAIKGNYRTGSAVRDLGCSIEFFKEYIEKQFQPGMSWENWGLDTWHIDHIISLSTVDLTNREQLLKVCHYTNQRPMWAERNIREGARHEKL